MAWPLVKLAFASASNVLEKRVHSLSAPKSSVKLAGRLNRPVRSARQLRPWALTHVMRFGVFLVMALLITRLPRDLFKLSAYPVYGILVVLLVGAAVFADAADAVATAICQLWRGEGQRRLARAVAAAR